jgi:hypothetical protein
LSLAKEFDESGRTDRPMDKQDEAVSFHYFADSLKDSLNI